MRHIKRILTAVVAIVLIFTTAVYAKVDFPQTTSKKYVNDYVNILPEDAINELVAIGDEL